MSMAPMCDGCVGLPACGWNRQAFKCPAAKDSCKILDVVLWPRTSPFGGIHGSFP
jgi:hypothetical protein